MTDPVPHAPEGEPEAAAPARSRLSSSIGVVLVQALSSITTLVQMALFAITLPRADFDDYAVWLTASMFMIGIGQAVGTERVVIGRRDPVDGERSAPVIGLAVAVAQVGVAAALQSVPLVLCSVAVLVYATYDYQRTTRCYDEAPLFLRCDVGVLLAQVTAVLVLWAVFGRSGWLVLAWWGAGLLPWGVLSRLRQDLRRGLAVLRDDRRESLPLLVDAALAGAPLVLALALARAQGAEGDASAARMAFTLLGPVTVLGYAARRIVYQHVGRNELGPRFAVTWTGICLAVWLTCFGLLALTRTPLYPWAFPGFEGLAWIAILGFATNHAAMYSTLLPAASLRADGDTRAIGIARFAATAGALVAILLLVPVDSPQRVAWVVAIGSIAYSLSLFVGRALVPRRERPDAVPEDAVPEDAVPEDTVPEDAEAPAEAEDGPRGATPERG